MVEIKHATDTTFQELVVDAERPVVVDFWAAWCGPCRMVAPELERLAEKYKGAVDVVKLDVDANPSVAQAYNILSLPTIAFFRPGLQPMGVVGFRPLEQLEQHFGLAQYEVAAEAVVAEVEAVETEVADAAAPETAASQSTSQKSLQN